MGWWGILSLFKGHEKIYKWDLLDYNMKRVLVLLVILLSIFFINVVSATVSCTPSSVSSQFEQGTPTSVLTLCTNLGSSPVSVEPIGSDFTLDTNTLGVTTNTIRVTFNENANVGPHSGSILFKDNNSTLVLTVLISFTIIDVPIVTDILVFPTSKIISVKQGEEKTQNILIIVPSSYPRAVLFHKADFNPVIETIRFGDLNLGLVAPGDSLRIPIVFSGVGASTGNYPTTLKIIATDEFLGQVTIPSVSLELQVTAGINPISNFSITELPTCSLNAVELNLNQTYSMTCSRPNANIDIATFIDNFYLKGISVEETPSQYIYSFKAQKIGNTVFKAKFLHKGSQIGYPFVQKIKISPSGSSPIPGTTLRFVFYQNGKETSIDELEATETIIQIEDNETGILITDYTLYRGGLEINNTLTLDANEDYEMRATSPGFVDSTVSFEVSRLPIEIMISPNKTNYFTGDLITITTVPENASVLVNGVIVDNGYTFMLSGNHTIKAISELYKTTSIFINVKPSINIIASSPETFEWKKGDDVITQLDKNVTWEVYRDGIQIASGEGNLVEFKITEVGTYNIKSEGNLIESVTVEEKGVWNWIKDNWLWFVGGLIIIIVIYLLFFRGRGEDEEGFSFQGKTSSPQD